MLRGTTMRYIGPQRHRYGFLCEYLGVKHYTDGTHDYLVRFVIDDVEWCVDLCDIEKVYQKEGKINVSIKSL